MTSPLMKRPNWLISMSAMSGPPEPAWPAIITLSCIWLYGKITQLMSKSGFLRF